MANGSKVMQLEVELGFEPRAFSAQIPGLKPYAVLTQVPFWCLKQDGHTSALLHAGQRQWLQAVFCVSVLALD